MLLTLPERFILLGLLPTKGKYADLTEIIRTKSYLNPSGEEMEDMQIKIDRHTGKVIGWDDNKVNGYQSDIPFGEWMMNTIRNILRDRDQKGELQQNELSLYDKFIIDYQQL